MKMLLTLSVLIAICSLASGALKYVPPAPSQSKCKQCNAEELQAGRAQRWGRTFLKYKCCNLESTCKCGITASSRTGRNDDIDDPNRIIGGVETGINEYPWMAGLVRTRQDTQTGCGASLVASQFVVTAAHCVEFSLPSDVFVVLGEHDTASTTETTLRKVVGVSKIILSPIWNKWTFVGDIAVLKLEEAVDLDVYTPICLPDFAETWIDGQNGLATGWGLDVQSSAFVEPTKLQEVDAPIQTQATCDATFAALGYYSAGFPQVTRGMVCAGITGMQNCFGDSGGHLSTTDGTQHTLVGAVSWGYCVTDPSIWPVPGVFTDVAVYRRWLDETFRAEGGAMFCSSN